MRAPCQIIRGLGILALAGLFGLWCGVWAAEADEEPIAEVSPAGMISESEPATWQAPGLIGGGFKGTEAHQEGSFFLTAPLRSTLGRDGTFGGSVWLLEPYISGAEQQELAMSLGLGWRHLFSQQPVGVALPSPETPVAGFFEEGVFVGANLFVDALDTQFHNRFWQVGGGLEFGSRYVEVRTNYYLPITGPQTSWFNTTESVTRRMETYYAPPRADGNEIRQFVGHGLYDVTTSLHRRFRVEESGLEGWDCEVALLIPGLDQWMDARIIPGYYQFQTQPFGPQTGGTGKTEGWKVGFEARPVPALVLNASWYEDPAFLGSDWSAGLRFEVPFELGDCGDGKTAWGRIRQAFQPRRRHLAERLVEPVKRQNAAVKTRSKLEEDVGWREITEDAEVLREDESEQRNVLSDVIFVNGSGALSSGIGRGDPKGNGSAGKPYAYAQDAVEEAAKRTRETGRLWNIYVEGSVPKEQAKYYDRQRYDLFIGGPGGETFSGFRLIGSGAPIEGGGERVFGSGVRPYFSGLSVRDFAEVSIRGVVADSISTYRVHDVLIADNWVGEDFVDFSRTRDWTSPDRPAQGGYYVVYYSGAIIYIRGPEESSDTPWLNGAIHVDGAQRAKIEANEVRAAFGEDGIAAEGDGGTYFIRDNNVHSPRRSAIGFNANGDWDMQISNNRLSGGDAGIQVWLQERSEGRLDVVDNVVSGHLNGVRLFASAGASIEASIRGNSVTGERDAAVSAEAEYDEYRSGAISIDHLWQNSLIGPRPLDVSGYVQVASPPVPPPRTSSSSSTGSSSSSGGSYGAGGATLNLGGFRGGVTNSSIRLWPPAPN